MTSQWPDNCGSITLIVIFNSLYIDFIHGDIHGRSCKKTLIVMVTGMLDIQMLNKKIEWDDLYIESF